MTNKLQTKFKIQSRNRWATICKELAGLLPILDREFTYKNCGYCKIYHNYTYTNACDKNCPLFKKSLCYNGYGVSFRNVQDYYQDCYICIKPMIDIDIALESAYKILLAIDKDLQKCLPKIN